MEKIQVKPVVFGGKSIVYKSVTLPPGWGTTEQFELYRKFLTNIPENGKYAELGVWKGQFICSAADIIKERNLTVYAVDTFDGGTTSTELQEVASVENIREIFEANMTSFGLTSSVIILQGLTEEKHTEVPDGSLDFVFVDAAHTYKNTKDNIKMWLPKIKRPGTLAGQAFRTRGKKLGVARAVHSSFHTYRVHHKIWVKNLK